MLVNKYKVKQKINEESLRIRYLNFTQDKMSTFEKLMNETVGGCG